MQKWEYCSVQISWFGQNPTMKASWRHCATTGSKGGELSREKKMSDKDAWDAAYRLIAQLGLEGWEMIGISNYGFTYERIDTHWFKRPLP